MAYDEALAERIRERLIGNRGVSEQRMLGGLALLIDGYLAIAASHDGGILVRVDPARSDHLIDTPKADVAVMRNRPMRGWLRVSAEHLRTTRQLTKWVDLSTTYARRLPAKRSIRWR